MPRARFFGGPIDGTWRETAFDALYYVVEQAPEPPVQVTDQIRLEKALDTFQRYMRCLPQGMKHRTSDIVIYVWEPLLNE